MIKRTQSLKEGDALNRSNGVERAAIADLEEDLIEPINTSSAVPVNLINPALVARTKVAQSIEIMARLVQKELGSCAQLLNIDQEELQAWIDLQIEGPAKTVLALLRLSQQYHLDPFRRSATDPIRRSIMASND